MTAPVALPQISVLGALPDNPGILESLAYQLNGLIVVFCALGSIWLLLELIGALFRRAERLRQARIASIPAPSPIADASAPVEVPVTAEGLEPALLAGIIAAVAVATDASARIVSVTPMDADWAREGRRQIFSSHKVR